MNLRDTYVMSADEVYWCVVFSTLVGVSVYSVMWSELMMMLEINICDHQYMHVLSHYL